MLYNISVTKQHLTLLILVNKHKKRSSNICNRKQKIYRKNKQRNRQYKQNRKYKYSKLLQFSRSKKQYGRNSRQTQKGNKFFK